MRVLHIGKYFPPYRGGIETYLHDLCVEQLELGLEVDVLVHATNVTLRDTTECITSDSGKNSGLLCRAARWFNVSFVPISPTFIFSLKKLLNRQPDVIHIHVPNASPLWLLLLPSARKIPWIVHWHSDIVTADAPLWLRWAYKLYALAERALLRHTTHIIATSQAYLDASLPLQRWRHKSQVIPLGLRANSIPQRPLQRKAASSRATAKILFVGRLVHYKGLDILINAMQFIKNAELWIVGQGPEFNTLQDQAKSHCVADRVTFFGAIEQQELEELFCQADCFCLPSRDRTEAFGMAALEALCRGLPVAATNLPGSGLPWVASHAHHFCLFEVDSPKQLATCITQLLVECSEGTPSAHVQQQFNLSFQSRALLDLYEHKRESST